METKFKYQNESAQLEEILKSVDRPGSFCTHGIVSKPMPRLEVDDVGILSFPVPRSQVEELLEIAELAPYGKGAQTLVDASVRNCWEINTDQFSVGGRSWKKTIRHLCGLAADGLGCPRGRLKAELYKLLVYETGGFFIPHVDSEKSDGMIATLTISLPAAGTGGELVVRHKDRERKIDLNVDDPSELAYAAFYADCQHEIKTVRSGNRIALIYNLCIATDDTETLRDAPDYSRKVQAIATELSNWCNKENSSNKLIWVLDHEYSQAGLSFDTLKNGDRAVASALHLASAQVDCELYACIVNINEFFSAAYIGGGYYHGYDDSNEYEVYELIEGRAWMDCWCSPDGSRPNFGDISIQDYELMPAAVLDDVAPNEEEFEETTGNEGASLDRNYHFAALVLMKRKRIVDVLVKQNATSAITWINEEIKRKDGRSDEYVIKLANRLIDQWPASNVYGRSADTRRMLGLLSTINDQRLSTRFMSDIGIRHYGSDENSEFVKVLCTLKAADAGDVLTELLKQKFLAHPRRLLKLLMLFNRESRYSVSKNRTIFGKCATEMMQLLPKSLSQVRDKMDYRPRSKHYYRDKYYVVISDNDKTKRIEYDEDAVKDIFLLFVHADAMDIALSVSKVFEQYPTAISLDRSVPGALVALSKIDGVFNSAAFSSLWHVSANYLLNRSGTPPEPPKDWKTTADIPCSCKHCRKLSIFCENPKKKVEMFKLRKDLREHLHRIIDDQNLDLFHETERKGRPYTLVCTKNRASYKRRLKEYKKDIDKMSLLVQAVPRTERSELIDGELTQLHNAIEDSRLSY